MRPRLRTGTGRRAAGTSRPCAMPTLTGQGGSVPAGGSEAPSPQPSPAWGGREQEASPYQTSGQDAALLGQASGQELRRWARKTPRRRASLIIPSPRAGEGPRERGGTGPYDALILAVAHRDFIDMGAAGLRALGKPKSVLYDVKAVLPADQVDG